MTTEPPSAGPAAEIPAGPAAEIPGFRGVMAATLVIESIVVLLALPVVGVVGAGYTWWRVTYLLALAVAMLVGAGLQRRRWALGYNLTLQALFVAGFVVHPAVGVMGVLAVLLWAYLLHLRREVAGRLARGELPVSRAG